LSGLSSGHFIKEHRTMTNESEHYYCDICGIVVRVLKGGGGTLVCCGQDMARISEDEARQMSAEG
jgi:desulfoferrodoxin-like iron-binding protein